MEHMVDSRVLTMFKRTVLNFSKKHGRHTLPWRKTRDPYRILVSEVMLQQTQVDRVIPKYREFLKQFPTIKTLAEASLGDVLRTWQGLGYNRRAKMLYETAKRITIYHTGRLPRSYGDLITLPGIGDYTAKAVRVFAWNEREVLIETNVRTVFIHHFFPNRKHVQDREILKVVESTLTRNESREWYAALMDYGSYLKRTIPNPSRKSAHHSLQKPFKGSDREVRGAILRALSRRSLSGKDLLGEPYEKNQIRVQCKKLLAEGLIQKKGARYQLP